MFIRRAIQTKELSPKLPAQVPIYRTVLAPLRLSGHTSHPSVTSVYSHLYELLMRLDTIRP